MTNVPQDQKRALKASAHHLDPIVIIGQKGLTDNVLAEIDLALHDHELIKIKAGQPDKASCEAFALHISEALKAEFIARVGKILIFYRKSNKKK